MPFKSLQQKDIEKFKQCINIQKLDLECMFDDLGDAERVRKLLGLEKYQLAESIVYEYLDNNHNGERLNIENPIHQTYLSACLNHLFDDPTKWKELKLDEQYTVASLLSSSKILINRTAEINNRFVEGASTAATIVGIVGSLSTGVGATACAVGVGCSGLVFKWLENSIESSPGISKEELQYFDTKLFTGDHWKDISNLKLCPEASRYAETLWKETYQQRLETVEKHDREYTISPPLPAQKVKEESLGTSCVLVGSEAKQIPSIVTTEHKHDLDGCDYEAKNAAAACKKDLELFEKEAIAEKEQLLDSINKKIIIKELLDNAAIVGKAVLECFKNKDNQDKLKESAIELENKLKAHQDKYNFSLDLKQFNSLIHSRYDLADITSIVYYQTAINIYGSILKNERTFKYLIQNVERLEKNVLYLDGQKNKYYSKIEEIHEAQLKIARKIKKINSDSLTSHFRTGLAVSSNFAFGPIAGAAITVGSVLLELFSGHKERRKRKKMLKMQQHMAKLENLEFMHSSLADQCERRISIYEQTIHSMDAHIQQLQAQDVGDPTEYIESQRKKVTTIEKQKEELQKKLLKLQETQKDLDQKLKSTEAKYNKKRFEESKTTFEQTKAEVEKNILEQKNINDAIKASSNQKQKEELQQKLKNLEKTKKELDKKLKVAEEIYNALKSEVNKVAHDQAQAEHEKNQLEQNEINEVIKDSSDAVKLLAKDIERNEYLKPIRAWQRKIVLERALGLTEEQAKLLQLTDEQRQQLTPSQLLEVKRLEELEKMYDRQDEIGKAYQAVLQTCQFQNQVIDGLLSSATSLVTAAEPLIGTNSSQCIKKCIMVVNNTHKIVETSSIMSNSWELFSQKFIVDPNFKGSWQQRIKEFGKLNFIQQFLTPTLTISALGVQLFTLMLGKEIKDPATMTLEVINEGFKSTDKALKELQQDVEKLRLELKQDVVGIKDHINKIGDSISDLVIHTAYTTETNFKQSFSLHTDTQKELKLMVYEQLKNRITKEVFKIQLLLTGFEHREKITKVLFLKNLQKLYLYTENSKQHIFHETKSSTQNTLMSKIDSPSYYIRALAKQLTPLMPLLSINELPNIHIFYSIAIITHHLFARFSKFKATLKPEEITSALYYVKTMHRHGENLYQFLTTLIKNDTWFKKLCQEYIRLSKETTNIILNIYHDEINKVEYKNVFDSESIRAKMESQLIGAHKFQFTNLLTRHFGDFIQTPQVTYFGNTNWLGVVDMKAHERLTAWRYTSLQQLIKDRRHDVLTTTTYRADRAAQSTYNLFYLDISPDLRLTNKGIDNDDDKEIISPFKLYVQNTYPEIYNSTRTGKMGSIVPAPFTLKIDGVKVCISKVINEVNPHLPDDILYVDTLREKFNREYNTAIKNLINEYFVALKAHDKMKFGIKPSESRKINGIDVADSIAIYPWETDQIILLLPNSYIEHLKQHPLMKNIFESDKSRNGISLRYRLEDKVAESGCYNLVLSFTCAAFYNSKIYQKCVDVVIAEFDSITVNSFKSLQASNLIKSNVSEFLLLAIYGTPPGTIRAPGLAAKGSCDLNGKGIICPVELPFIGLYRILNKLQHKSQEFNAFKYQSNHYDEKIRMLLKNWIDGDKPTPAELKPLVFSCTLSSRAVVLDESIDEKIHAKRDTILNRIHTSAEYRKLRQELSQTYETLVAACKLITGREYDSIAQQLEDQYGIYHPNYLESSEINASGHYENVTKFAARECNFDQFKDKVGSKYFNEKPSELISILNSLLIKLKYCEQILDKPNQKSDEVKMSALDYNALSLPEVDDESEALLFEKIKQGITGLKSFRFYQKAVSEHTRGDQLRSGILVGSIFSKPQDSDQRKAVDALSKSSTQPAASDAMASCNY